MNKGEVDRAMEWLERAFEARDVYLVHLRASPLFDLARGHARFPDLLERTTFPAPEAR